MLSANVDEFLPGDVVGILQNFLSDVFFNLRVLNKCIPNIFLLNDANVAKWDGLHAKWGVGTVENLDVTEEYTLRNLPQLHKHALIVVLERLGLARLDDHHLVVRLVLVHDACLRLQEMDMHSADEVADLLVLVLECC